MAYRRTEEISHRIAARREAILASARAVVTAEGFQALNMQLIADRTGLATGTLYRYFRSKAELCQEIVTAISEREVAVLRRIAASDDAPLERLWRAVFAFSRRAMRARTLAYALMAEPVGPEVDQLRLHYREELAKVLVGLIEASVAAGTLPPQDARARAAFMVGAFIEGVIGPHAPEVPPERHVALASDIASFCLLGAGASPQALASLGHARAA